MSLFCFHPCHLFYNLPNMLPQLVHQDTLLCCRIIIRIANSKEIIWICQRTIIFNSYFPTNLFKRSMKYSLFHSENIILVSGNNAQCSRSTFHYNEGNHQFDISFPHALLNTTQFIVCACGFRLIIPSSLIFAVRWKPVKCTKFPNNHSIDGKMSIHRKSNSWINFRRTYYNNIRHIDTLNDTWWSTSGFCVNRFVPYCSQVFIEVMQLCLLLHASVARMNKL